jgi:transcriptional regulator with XRE-family HTH domain
LNDRDPRVLLAQRLRALREEHWPGRKITQPQLAQALGVTPPLISSWESTSRPHVPPLVRVDAYAVVFATSRSFDASSPRQLGPAELDEGERRAMNELMAELRQLRNAALRAGAEVTGDHSPETASVSEGPWRFNLGEQIAIVCGQVPPTILQSVPYSDVYDPDYIELLKYSDLDSLFELYGHVRAANPESYVARRFATTVSNEELQSHVVVLGGRDWNPLTVTLMEELELPVQQVADWSVEGGQYFEVQGKDAVSQYRPVLRRVGGKGLLHEDVALFARAVNPWNNEMTVTICCGMYGRGTYGAIRALTDYRIRERNNRYIASRFAGSEAYCIVTRVPVVQGGTLTPDWTTGNHRLFEWSR